MQKKSGITIVAFGDSITTATRQTEDQRWPELLKHQLTGRFPDVQWTVINAGVGGNTSREGLARIDADVIRHRPDYVLVEFGGNDATPDPSRHVSLEEYENNLTLIQSNIERVSARSLLLTFPPIIDRWHTHHQHPFYREAGGQDAYIEAYRRVTREFAARNRLVLADIDLALRRYIDQNHPETIILPDGVHLTDKGNCAVADCVFDALAGLMRPMT
ncbi:MAG: hypothetical protein KKG09_02340 [Verrucomicrobia bacterium]|nr:hypothetical protein [Verrucomicrobiota bacterium]MCG2679049.1 GDSL-type esterase/lipase family protein [Kiritimatiellia bacterium]MBU4247575.1 hypothetical protein [Verrucomicrobiota bacterium]MBU4291189.1 hypothetical protein [Verrucomicrobiota bacterium]MBU4428468.1 hypothetical protein [Verrucomicrobiota bacterium]